MYVFWPHCITIFTTTTTTDTHCPSVALDFSVWVIYTIFALFVTWQWVSCSLVTEKIYYGGGSYIDSVLFSNTGNWYVFLRKKIYRESPALHQFLPAECNKLKGGKNFFGFMKPKGLYIFCLCFFTIFFHTCYDYYNSRLFHLENRNKNI